jgi:hypothetical protein
MGTAENWDFALSVGERVSCYRCSHQPEQDGRGRLDDGEEQDWGRKGKVMQ